MPIRQRGLAAVVAVTLTGCSVADLLPIATPSPTPSPTASPSPTPLPTPSPTPSPTPLPTPTYTNEPDPELSALIPDSVGGATIVKPPPTAFGITPGDIGEAFGEIGLSFKTLVIGHVAESRTALYAMRRAEPSGETADLRPHLVEIGRYLGISGTDADWRLVTIGGNVSWMRSGGASNLRGTTVYTWLTDDYAFLLIGGNDSLNRAIVAALPGKPAATPAPS